MLVLFWMFLVSYSDEFLYFSKFIYHDLDVSLTISIWFIKEDSRLTFFLSLLFLGAHKLSMKQIWKSQKFLYELQWVQVCTCRGRLYCLQNYQKLILMCVTSLCCWCCRNGITWRTGWTAGCTSLSSGLVPSRSLKVGEPVEISTAENAGKSHILLL